MPFKVRVMDDRFKVGTDVINWDDPFWSFVAPEMLSGCWLWTGSLSSGERRDSLESAKLTTGEFNEP